MKRCRTCGEEFPPQHYAIDSGYKDGRKPDCSQCRSVEARAHEERKRNRQFRSLVAWPRVSA